MNKKSGSGKPIILVDGSSFLYRAFHAMPNLMNSKRQPTGAVYGIVNMLKNLLKEHQPESMAVVFDAPGKTFRDDLYEQYKANRSAMPDDLRRQIDWVHEIVEALGLPLLSVKGVEADDVIGTFAKQAEEKNLSVLICSGDKDLSQLVTEKVLVSDTMKGVTYNIEGVKEKMGVYPHQIIDYLALIGDTSDNIPGVPKVGPKTAAKWLDQYETLDNLLEHVDDIKGKVGENLRDCVEQIPLSHQLATIKTDVELDQTIEQLSLNTPDEEKLKAMYAELQFKTWLSELGGITEEKPKFDRDKTEIILTQKQLNTWIKHLKTCDTFALDTETTSLHSLEAELVGISFSDGKKAAYIPVGHAYEGVQKQLPLDEVLELLKPLFENKKPAKILQNLKYDLAVFRNYGINIENAQFDTMLESYVLDSTSSRHDMDTLALKHLGHKTIHYEDIAGKGKDQKRFDEIEIETAAPYAGEDAAITYQLHETLWPGLKEIKNLKSVFEDIEMPLISVLESVERNGVKINTQKLIAQSQEIAKQTEQLESQAHDIAGKAFNLSSPKQIQEILFEEQKLPVLKKTPKGQPSTAEDVLQDLAVDYELPALILQHRSLSKLKSTYTDKLPDLVNPATGRIHTSYHQAVAATGRLSSADPNLQNIPIRTAEGRRIREAFEPENGYVLLAADYSQIELRIMAHLSRDKGLLDAFAKGEDVHRATASEVFGTKLADVTDDQRRNAKAINFGLIYGMSSFGLGQQLGISRQEAQEYIDLYFDRYPGVKKYMDDTREQAHDTGFVETVFGRRLYLPEINSSNFNRRQYAERTAINAPMQGTAADIIKKAMIKAHTELPNVSKNSKMIMQVHDELVLEVPEKDSKKVSQAITEIMSGVANLKVPLIVETGTGTNWAQAH